MSKLLIPINRISEDFQYHLDNNKRILFSGKYGTGKTYFLKEFFKGFDSYEVFHLFPVNYQVATNDDIFELIKYDIIYHLLIKGWYNNEHKEHITKTLAIQGYFAKESYNVFSSILKVLAVGKSKGITEVVQELGDMAQKFSNYYKSLNEGALDVFEEYSNTFAKTKGSIYECDSVTQLIYELISTHKEAKDSEKETVLIIDDLDRIDPEHIFRLLNVFSAHFDLDNEDENKFGFDKVVFVCDIENVRNIFSAKYGVNTDFNGYINKFFSSYIYKFDNKERIEDGVMRFIESYFDQKDTHKVYLSVKGLLKKFLSFHIYSNTINMRHLKNLEKIDLKKIDLKNAHSFKRRLFFHNLISILLYIFNNDTEKFLAAFEEVKFDDNMDIKEYRYLEHIIPLIDSFDSYRTSDHIRIYKNEKLNLVVHYKIARTPDLVLAEIEKITNSIAKEREITNQDIKFLMIEGIKNLKNTDHLNCWETY